MNDQKIKIRLPAAREKLQALFPEDNRGDVKIIFGQKVFKLQRAFLRLQSGYFKKTFAQSCELLEIKESFSEDYFSNILKCFYGATIEMSRVEVLDYFPIIKFLEVESLLKFLREDMVNKAEHYDIFILMQLAHRYSEQQIFETCLTQLEKEGFQQLRYSKPELLKCPEELFKMIIKTHNRMKATGGKGLQFLEIDQLIRQFCEEKRLPQSRYQELKFQLIDKTALTSQEYKEIFLKKNTTSKEYRSMIRTSPSNQVFKGGLGQNLKLTESVIEPFSKTTTNQLTLQMENTFQKKLNEELRAQNAFLMTELTALKQSSAENKKVNASLQQSLNSFKNSLHQKQKEDKQQKILISKLEKQMNDMRKELNQKGQLIKKLEQKVSKLEKTQKKGGHQKYIANSDEEEDQSKTIQSQIVPAHLLKDIAKPAADNMAKTNQNGGGFSKNKGKSAPQVVITKLTEEEQMDDQDLEEMYMSRISFDSEPSSAPKKLLPKLANIMSSDGFEKKKLALVFRRSLTKDNFGKHEDIRGKNSLLIILKTKENQVIGGFTSIMIQKQSCDYLSDETAFLFSLTKNQKFSIKKTSVTEAIFLSEHYLICFANDLMIPIECLKDQSECSWPASYQTGNATGDKKNSKWLTGEEGSFTIKQIDIYQVEEGAMEMVL